MTTKERFWTYCEGLEHTFNIPEIIKYRDNDYHIVFSLDMERNYVKCNYSLLNDIRTCDIISFRKFLIAEISEHTKLDLNGHFFF